MTEQEVIQVLGDGYIVMADLGVSKVLQWSNSEESAAFVNFTDGKVAKQSSVLLPK